MYVHINITELSYLFHRIGCFHIVPYVVRTSLFKPSCFLALMPPLLRKAYLYVQYVVGLWVGCPISIEILPCCESPFFPSPFSLCMVVVKEGKRRPEKKEEFPLLNLEYCKGFCGSLTFEITFG